MNPLRLEVAGALAPQDIIAGLSCTPRSIPCKYLYDERGAALFEAICRLDEYYPTRTEIGILEKHSNQIAAWVGRDARVVEYGSGSGEKTRLLLAQLHSPREYLPIDVSFTQLLRHAANLRNRFPGLRVSPVHADYTKRFRLSFNGHSRRTIVFFPGSTIGNFEPLEAIAFLRRAADVARGGGGLLIGVDLKKPASVLGRAYNDAHGVTAAFNLNILSHVNAVCGADFEQSNFEHVAFYNEDAGRIEMHLRSLVAQQITLSAGQIDLERGELIGTEHSYKYDPNEFSELVRQAGFRLRRRWFDAQRWFGVYAFDVDA